MNNEENPNSIEFYRNQPTQWIQQTPAIINQAAPVQNTWYTVLAATGKYTQINFLGLRVETANETLELEILIDGINVGFTALAATFGTAYTVAFAMDSSSGNMLFASTSTVLASLNLMGHNISVRIRKTTATGAGNLRCKVAYAVM